MLTNYVKVNQSLLNSGTMRQQLVEKLQNNIRSIDINDDLFDQDQVVRSYSDLRETVLFDDYTIYLNDSELQSDIKYVIKTLKQLVDFVFENLSHKR